MRQDICIFMECDRGVSYETKINPNIIQSKSRPCDGPCHKLFYTEPMDDKTTKWHANLFFLVKSKVSF